jgi:ACS family hexuronate transporter-like MFS transporter
MHQERSSTWRWSLCGLLFLSTLLNYMDRQTLSQLSTLITRQFSLSNEQYGNLELTFGLSFVAGSIVIGLIADRLNVLWMYPAVLIGWSLAGVAAAYSVNIGFSVDRLLHGATAEDPSRHGYLGLLLCRAMLGFFEAGQWPCAIVTTRRILNARDRTFGNGLLQSGGAIGAVLTPIVISQIVDPTQSGSWRLPFIVIGSVGLLWIVPWFLMVRSSDLSIEREKELALEDGGKNSTVVVHPRSIVIRRFLALAVLIVAVNMTWHFFRAWLPKFLQEFHHYKFEFVQYYTIFFYLAADLGCIAVGIAVKKLATRGRNLQSARLLTYFACCLCTALTVVAADLKAGYLLLGLLTIIGFGSMGMFPLYYSFTQEISARNQGKVTGALAAVAWVFTATMQKMVGRSVDETGSYASSIFWLGLAPILGGIAVWLLWGRDAEQPAKNLA